uniref:Uncharacterized protein LOC108950802 n=1 Tax=Phallusia mammillata TaxID=59560 RepID=A0A6F9DKA0_9ASCI|nr:uncharacterized protein LOC108950802 [Phallusia mammillata]
MEHELAMKKLELELEDRRSREETTSTSTTCSNAGTGKCPELPKFVDGVDDMDGYLLRFERYAENSGWERNQWAPWLSALLTGKAMGVYSRLSAEEARDYEALKRALRERYGLREDGYRNKFNNEIQQQGETVSQYFVRFENYLDSWVEMAGIEKTYKGLKELFLHEKFHKDSYRELSLYMRQHSTNDLKQFAETADRFLGPLKKTISGHSCDTKHPRAAVYYSNCERPKYLGEDYHIHRPGPDDRRCFNCNGRGHLARDCHVRTAGSGAEPRHRGGKIENALFVQKCSYKLKPTLGQVGQRTVETIRDTGCTSVMVRRSLVTDDQMTGQIRYVQGFIGDPEPMPTAMITIDTPYYSGTVEALCVSDLNVELIIGNIAGARDWESPEPNCRGKFIKPDTEVMQSKPSEQNPVAKQLLSSQLCTTEGDLERVHSTTEDKEQPSSNKITAAPTDENAISNADEQLSYRIKAEPFRSSETSASFIEKGRNQERGKKRKRTRWKRTTLRK